MALITSKISSTNKKGLCELKHQLHEKCIKLCNSLRANNVLIQRGQTSKYNKHGKIVGIQPIWDLPTCACYCSAQGISAEGYSHRMQKCHPILEKRINLFGSVGSVASKRALAKNHEPWPLGQCAEQHAANHLLYEANERPLPKGRRRNHKVGFGDIYVGPACRVKTRQFMPACRNCRAIFSTKIL